MRPPNLVAWVATALLISAPLASQERNLRVGEPAPQLQGRSLKHGPVSLAALHGNVVLVNFWATTCGSCMAKIPDMKELHQKYREQGLRIVSVSLDDDVKAVRKVVSRQGIDWPQVCDRKGLDSPIAKAFKVHGTPSIFLIDREGNLAARNLRARELDEAIGRLLQGP